MCTGRDVVAGAIPAASLSWHTHMESANQTLALDICECQLDLIHASPWRSPTLMSGWLSDIRRLWPELFEPAVVEPTVAFLAHLSGTGPALEFGVGTGRIAIPSANGAFTEAFNHTRSTIAAMAPLWVGEITRVAVLGPASRNRFRRSAGSTSMPRFLISSTPI